MCKFCFSSSRSILRVTLFYHSFHFRIPAKLIGNPPSGLSRSLQQQQQQQLQQLSPPSSKWSPQQPSQQQDYPEVSYSPNYPDNIDNMLLDRALDARLSSQQMPSQQQQQQQLHEGGLMKHHKFSEGEVLCDRSPVAVNCTNSTDELCQDKGFYFINKFTHYSFCADFHESSPRIIPLGIV